LDWGTFVKKVIERHDFELALMGGKQGPEPDTCFRVYIMKGAYRNIGGYNNSRVDELINKGVTVVDRKERAKYYHEICRELVKDLPRIALLTLNNAYPCSVGFRNTPLENYAVSKGMLLRFDKTWWEQATGVLPAATTTATTTTGTTALAPADTTTWYAAGALGVVIIAAALLVKLARKRSSSKTPS